MKEQVVGREILKTANGIKSIAFRGFWDGMEGEGPTGMQHWILGYLNDNRGKDVFQKDLEKDFMIQRSTATELLKAMERKDLITRVPVKEDRRSKKIYLTNRAETALKRNHKNVIELERQIRRDIPEEQLDDLCRLLKKIQENVDMMDT